MSMKTNLGLAALALVAILVAGIAYWALRENTQLGAPSGSAGAPPVAPQATAPPAPPASSTAPQTQATAPSAAPVAPQATAPPAPPASQSASTAPQSQATAPSAPAPAAPSSPPVIAQSNQPAASPAKPPSANAESPVPSPATPAAPMTTLPAEDQMSEADRRQVQEVLERLGYYQGPIDGEFGQLTRAAIRRYQDSIGAKSTGYLTAEEATRLASTH
jgi:Putative peptidoglycan binding domain